MTLLPWTRLLRSWQSRALLLTRQRGPDCLIMATPAAGKTTCALRVAHDQLESGRCERVVIVCPTDHLRTQWTDAAAAVGIQLDPELHGRRCVEAADYVGAVVTYQQVAGNPAAFAGATGRRRTLVVFDEVHHAADGKEWGTGLREAFGLASYRLALSGTPFRSDDAPIPFIRYVDGVCTPDFAYQYAEALTDRVCRPIYFPSYEGELTWQYNGKTHQATFAESLTETQARCRLKTALLESGWLGEVLADAHARLQGIRDKSHAGGLVIAMDQDHARDVAALLQRITGHPVPVAISDDPDSSTTIARFAASSEPWMVAVKMVSEGVDIPRLRIGVYATNVSTEMYFRQVVGRFVRARGAVERAWLYLPKDPQLIGYAQAIQQERNHVLEASEPAKAPADPARPGAGRVNGSYTSLGGSARADELFGVDLEPSRRAIEWPAVDEGPLSLADKKLVLREMHAELVGQIARKTSHSHREINLELIKRVGGRIETATEAQLKTRIGLLKSWQRHGGMR